MKKIADLTGKLFYAITFLILIPAGLFFWAKYTEPLISFPKVESQIIGGILMLAGGLFMVWAMAVLILSGKGLPMNAYPPSRVCFIKCN